MGSLLAKIENAGKMATQSCLLLGSRGGPHGHSRERLAASATKTSKVPTYLSRRALVLSALTASILPSPAVLAEAARPEIAAGSPADAILAEFGFDAGDSRDVDAGDIVVIDVDATQSNELASAAAMRLPLPPGDLAERIRRDLLILADGKRRAHARIEAKFGDEAWSAVRFDENDEAEVARLFRVEPGEKFNLSSAEIVMIRRRLAVQTAQPATADLASAAWREVLRGRYAGYLAQGPVGLADYDRGDSRSSPADQLRRMASAAVPRPMSPVARALALYPAAQPPWLDSRFFWKKTEADGRAVFVLSHVMVGETAAATLFALREYYVGHSYNVLEQLGIAVPYDGGSLMLIVNSTVTDRIGGPLGIIARPIGRHQARQAVRDYFAGIRGWCTHPPP
jgi:hypothetical protein